MSCPDRLSAWKQEVSRAFAHLSQAQLAGLVLWSAGIALSGSSGISQVSALLAQVLGQHEASVTQRLREWYLDARHKRGDHRRDLEVASCFGPLLRWIITCWGGQERRLALALDASTLANRWTVLSISVLIRGCAIPVAWKVIGAHAKGSWRPYWEEMLARLQGSVPTDWQVLVLADRGLYAHWLYTAIVACGWHPFLRINLAIKARAQGEEAFDWISRWLPAPGAKWQGVVECFVQTKSRLHCTLLMQWEVGYEHAWIVLTDLAPEQANVAWYGLRSWIEAGFKDVKRGGLGWHHCKMRDAGRVERLWLAMAVAMVWMIGVGSHADSQCPLACWEQLPATHIARKRLQRALTQAPARRLSCLQRGRLVLLAALFRAEPLPLAHFVPEPWPETVTPPKRRLKPSQQRQRQKQRARKKRQRAAQRRKAAA
ncbi:MAG TPA: transposase [Ktedonobacteraceae bacterium]|nr:transposase [Ktedonobacteraceae bacterium]